MDDQLSKWLQGEISSEELKKNISTDDAIKYQQIVNEVDQWVPDNSTQLFNPNVVLDRPKKGKVRSIQSWFSYSIAASLVIAIGTYLLFFNSSSITTHTTGIAEIKEILLPDGASKVTLASGSEISWNEEDWNPQMVENTKLGKSKSRKVKLRGKALFAVEKGDAFSVSTSSGLVEVLGTVFEVDEFGNGMNVICFEGKVRAEADGNEVIVDDGNSFLFYDGKWEDRISIDETLPSWLKNETTFENAPLNQVMKSLEKLYDITFEVGSTNIKKRFNGTIPNDNIKVALRIVFDPFNIEYERKGDVIYLTD